MSIASFEVDMQGARNFIDLALSSPYTPAPTIIFVSSVGVFTSALVHEYHPMTRTNMIGV